MKSDAKRCLASALLEQIKISCYTEYKAFGPSLIYNNVITLGANTVYQMNRIITQTDYSYFVIYGLWDLYDLSY